MVKYGQDDEIIKVGKDYSDNGADIGHVDTDVDVNEIKKTGKDNTDNWNNWIDTGHVDTDDDVNEIIWI